MTTELDNFIKRGIVGDVTLTSFNEYILYQAPSRVRISSRMVASSNCMYMSLGGESLLRC